MFANVAPDVGPHFHSSTLTQVVQVGCLVMFFVAGAWAMLGGRQKWRRRWLVALAFFSVYCGISFWWKVRDNEVREEACRPAADPAHESRP